MGPSQWVLEHVGPYFLTGEKFLEGGQIVRGINVFAEHHGLCIPWAEQRLRHMGRAGEEWTRQAGRADRGLVSLPEGGQASGGGGRLKKREGERPQPHGPVSGQLPDGGRPSQHRGPFVYLLKTFLMFIYF